MSTLSTFLLWAHPAVPHIYMCSVPATVYCMYGLSHYIPFKHRYDHTPWRAIVPAPFSTCKTNCTEPSFVGMIQNRTHSVPTVSYTKAAIRCRYPPVRLPFCATIHGPFSVRRPPKYKRDVDFPWNGPRPLPFQREINRSLKNVPHAVEGTAHVITGQKRTVPQSVPCQLCLPGYWNCCVSYQIPQSPTITLKLF
jgi:hypothetical protein